MNSERQGVRMAAGEMGGGRSESAHPGAEPRTSGGETILVLDDQEAVRAVTRRVLQRHGYNVLEADSGAAAIRIADDFPGRIELMLADVIMPGQGGAQTAAELRAARPSTKLLLMSGYSPQDIGAHGDGLEGVPFLQKPFTAVSLCGKVREVLDSSHGDGAS